MNHTITIRVYTTTTSSDCHNYRFTGNWSPSDFPNGTSWEPYKESNTSVNRDLEIVLEDAGVADYFATVYNADWALGKSWKPR